MHLVFQSVTYSNQFEMSPSEEGFFIVNMFAKVLRGLLSSGASRVLERKEGDHNVGTPTK
jgi:hypothetical protein